MGFRYWPQILVFILAYGLEVEVQAALEQGSWFSEPEGCEMNLENSPEESGCLLRALPAQGASQLSWKGAQVYAFPGTVIFVQGEGLRLLKGELILKDSDLELQDREDASTIVLGTEYGRMISQAGVWLMLKREADHWMEVDVLRGSVDLKLLGHQEKLSVGQGFSLRFGPVNEKGLSQVELPQPVRVQSVLMRWLRGTQKDPEVWRTKVQLVLPSWQTAAEEIALWQSQTVLRHLASVQEEERKRAQRALQRQREDEELRRLFRQKNYLE